MINFNLVDNYIYEIEWLQEIARNNIVKSIKEKWSWNKKQGFLNRFAHNLNNVHDQLNLYEKELGLSWLPDERIRLLNNTYTKLYSFLRENVVVDKTDLNRAVLSNLFTKMEDIFSVTYKNGAKHELDDYLDSAILDDLAKKEAEITYNNLIEQDITFVRVSSQESINTCYLCIPWLGTVGTVGKDVDGYPRLDGMFPIHQRCVHYLIPISEAEANISIAPKWAWTANKSEYYYRYISSTEGRIEQARLNHEYYLSSKAKRIRKLVNEFL